MSFLHYSWPLQITTQLHSFCNVEAFVTWFFYLQIKDVRVKLKWVDSGLFIPPCTHIAIIFQGTTFELQNWERNQFIISSYIFCGVDSISSISKIKGSLWYSHTFSSIHLHWYAEITSLIFLENDKDAPMLRKMKSIAINEWVVLAFECTGQELGDRRTLMCLWQGSGWSSVEYRYTHYSFGTVYTDTNFVYVYICYILMFNCMYSLDQD